MLTLFVNELLYKNTQCNIGNKELLLYYYYYYLKCKPSCWWTEDDVFISMAKSSVKFHT